MCITPGDAENPLLFLDEEVELLTVLLAGIRSGDVEWRARTTEDIEADVRDLIEEFTPGCKYNFVRNNL